MNINLISDTVTTPSEGMRKTMAAAEVGDDVFGEDPTVNRLEDMAACMFGKEAALYCPSGTMTNQIAIKTHTQPLDELICEINSHVYQYETGGYSFNSGVAVNLIQGEYGKLNAEQIKDAIKATYDWLPNTSLVVIENSTNKGGGNFYTLDEIKEIRAVCQENKLALHLDGARLFNVLVETGDTTLEVGEQFDSISICLSKGLGAPVGSLLIGNKEFIKQARRFRKVMGGGMRQAGIIASAGIYALENNVDRLKNDNDHAKRIGKILENQDYVESVLPIRTNIIIFNLKYDTADQFLEKLKAHHVTAHAFGPKQVRFVTHLDFTSEMMDELEKILNLIN
ncbi:MAG: low specificity L-threonine aldolase [Saprospiraceae bacterium]|nr:low specificity L-threonine aldolase [Bacteroidia bacterium]NNF21996.1 low specificity L-threonine aldolase [Saprospiraceae bacterium]NNK89550.1 low specificity L-threonine aldolase [Saprospiraceae bacterium]